MSVADILLVLGAGVLSAGLRSYRHPVVHKLGTMGIFATSFLAGWLLGGSVVLGIVLALSWLFLPWVEILTRVRRLRLPMDRTLCPRRPPPQSLFPHFSELSEEIEAANFEQIGDMGWEHDETRHFYRVFYHRGSRTEAIICLAEQREFAFYYLSVTSRAKSGKVYMTWNYPFSYSLGVSPRLKIHRIHGDLTFDGLLAEHGQFLEQSRIRSEDIPAAATDAILPALEHDMRDQIVYNLSIGVLKRDGDQLIRYSVRGMFFLWFQFLRDLVRLS